MADTKKLVRKRNAPIAGICNKAARNEDEKQLRDDWVNAQVIANATFYIICWLLIPLEEK